MRGSGGSTRGPAFVQGHSMTAFLSSVLRFGNVVRDCKLDVTQPRKKIIHGFYDEGARFLCSHSLGRSLSLSLSLLFRNCLSSTTVRVPLPALIKSLFSPPYSSWIGKPESLGRGLALRNDAHNAALSICPISLPEAAAFFQCCRGGHNCLHIV